MPARPLAINPNLLLHYLAELYGTLLLSTISFLIAKDEFKEHGSIKNLGLVLALFLLFVT